MSIKDSILKYAKEELETKPETPWIQYPDDIVLRHSNNRKWYAVIMKIPMNKLGIESKDIIDIINVKCDPILVSSLLQNSGYFPAYHMNKTHWVSILLDGTVSKNEVINFLNISFNKTK